MDSQAASKLAAEFRALGEYIHGTADPSGALDRIVTLAQRSIPGCDWVSITEVESTARTLAASGDVARDVDLVQAGCDVGPCLQAARDEEIVQADDLTTESRWPEFVKRARAETPVCAILAFVLDQRSPRAALNLYAGKPHAFDTESVTMASLFAMHAQLAVLHLDAASKSANLEQALSTSRQIGAAIGILMAAHKVTSDDAFDMLRRTSQQLHRKLRDVAVEVTETGTLP